MLHYYGSGEGGSSVALMAEPVRHRAGSPGLHVSFPKTLIPKFFPLCVVFGQKLL